MRVEKSTLIFFLKGELFMKILVNFNTKAVFTHFDEAFIAFQCNDNLFY